MLCVAFYICFFIQSLLFLICACISCCVIFCYVIWCIPQVSFRGFALCYLHCCCVHSCICLLAPVWKFLFVYWEREREKEEGKRRGEARRKRMRERERREEFLGLSYTCLSFTHYCQITLQSDCASDTPILFSLANAFLKSKT